MTRLLSLIALIVMLFSISNAAASPDCMTLSEARHLYPDKHLWWKGNHCWTDTRGERRHAERTKPAPEQVTVPLPKERPELLVTEVANAVPIVASEPPVQNWAYSYRWPDCQDNHQHCAVSIHAPIDEATIEVVPIIKPQPPNQTIGIVLMIILTVGIGLTIVDVLFGARIFNRRHTKAVRFGYYP
jgi:hypothetical protein